MKITRTSRYSGMTRTKDIDITYEQLGRWMMGEYIQHVAPCLSQDDREFLISGMTPEEWDELYLSEDVRDDRHED